MPASPEKKCPDCGTVLNQMGVGTTLSEKIESTFNYCESCIALFVDDKKTAVKDFKENFLGNVKDLEAVTADKIMEAIQKDEKMIFENPSERIRAYFKRVFNWAFTEGFLRSYAQFKRQYKEGRMTRIREIWGETREHLFKYKVMNLSHEDLVELDKLINL